MRLRRADKTESLRASPINDEKASMPPLSDSSKPITSSMRPSAALKEQRKKQPMLHHFGRTRIVPEEEKNLIGYAGNCSGQNKNNLVIKFLLAQVQMGIFNESTTIFVKDRTKNPCERGFGNTHKFISRQDLRTMNQIVGAGKASAESNSNIHNARGGDFCISYKPLVDQLCKILVDVQFKNFSVVG
ncbi:Hypothetical protein PHPALM_11526 [Phytophthora palmivora]|uniref:DUF7869 domain-containing protein n=1 Tax=Phytophthora palmivora TaxID=4796 RepID=A0A2P4Y226_9STRA|nr:Hypothetical protein PHPALM_11526 [Phytophthora palmivora]